MKKVTYFIILLIFSNFSIAADIYDEFIYSVRDCDFLKVKQMLDTGFDVNAADESGWTALHWSNFTYEQDKQKFIQMLEYLIKNGADVNALDKRGRNVLHILLEPGDDQISPPPISAIQILIDNGVNIKIKNEDGDSALSIGLNSEHEKVRSFFNQASKWTK